jgi:hypothetical protein
MNLFDVVYDPAIDGALLIYRNDFFKLTARQRLDCIQDAVGELNELYREIENECIQEASNRKVNAAINAVKKIGKE